MWNAVSTWIRRRTGLVLAGAILASLAVLSPVAAEGTKQPRPPFGVTVVAVSPTSASVSWQAPKRNRRLGQAAGFGLYLNGSRVARTKELRYTFRGLNCGKTYTLGVDRYFASGRRSELVTLTTSTALCTPAPAPRDTSPPSPPSRVTQTAKTANAISLAWNPAADDVGVAGYGAYRTGAKIGTTADTRYTFMNLSCGTTYRLGVDGFDAAGNRSRIVTTNASTAACGSPPPPPPPPPPLPPPSPPRTGNPLPDFTFSWDQPPTASWDRVFRGFRYPNSASSGVCRPANPTHIPLDQVVTVTPAANRFNFTTNGGHLHALADAADGGNCNALRSEFSGPEDATHPFPTRSFLEKDGDEVWYGFSAKWPATGAYLTGWDSMGLFGLAAGSHVQHPSYGGAIQFVGRNNTSVTMHLRVGHHPSPSAGFNDSIASAGGCMPDWVPVTASRCPNSSNHNGLNLDVPLLGTGAPRPLTRDVWHDWIFHIVIQGETNGVLEILHREQGGVWERLYSNAPSLPALINRAPHPTQQWNAQFGSPGDGTSQPGDVFFQLYRGKSHATEHVFQSGIVRRQSEAAVKAVFP